MFENKTYENIMSEMLSNVPSDVDKREGSVIYDALSPIALEIAQVYSDLSVLLDESFADTASYYYLIKRAAERGIIVKEGTAAIIKIKATPSTVEIEEGAEFSIGENSYSVTSNEGSGYYLITCNDSGEQGNNVYDDIVPIEYIDGLESVEFVEINKYGTDDESEDELRSRYTESFYSLAFGGNVADYVEKANALDYVSACRVTSAWNGAGTVKLTLAGNGTDGISTLSDSNLSSAQTYFNGIAPIGHTVTCVQAEEENVAIAIALTYGTTQTNNVVIANKAEILTKIAEYQKELRASWEKSDCIIRPSHIQEICYSTNSAITAATVKVAGSTADKTTANLPKLNATIS